MKGPELEESGPLPLLPGNARYEFHANECVPSSIMLFCVPFKACSREHANAGGPILGCDVRQVLSWA